MIKNILFAAMIATSVGAITMTAPAAARDVYVRVAPPPPREEILPAPRRGHVWAPGYWDYRGKRHVWVKGNYMRERPGHRWEEHRWVERDGRWQLQRGRWARGDRDGDGVRNSQDRYPNNPRRN